MSNFSLPGDNVRVRIGLLERVLIFAVTMLPSCFFFSLNVMMLFVLRSKPVFRETSRYILLFNLLFADTVQIQMGQLLFVLTISRITLTYPLCGFLMMISLLTSRISPLTLTVMSLETYVAVCYPLRHASIITSRNTGKAVLAVWALSSLSLVIHAILLQRFPFQNLDSLQMEAFCNFINVFLMPENTLFDEVYSYFIFITSGVSVISCYIGVTIAARSASTDPASAQKARNTLLLHLMQLGLSLCSTMYSAIIVFFSKLVTLIAFARLQIFFYVLIVVSPRCLSSLIYGLRDQSIRAVFVYHLSCRVKVSLI